MAGEMPKKSVFAETPPKIPPHIRRDDKARDNRNQRIKDKKTVKKIRKFSYHNSTPPKKFCQIFDKIFLQRKIPHHCGTNCLQ
ncbi:MAG: hypothetical protein WCJ45_06110 [bacterium]